MTCMLMSSINHWPDLIIFFHFSKKIELSSLDPTLPKSHEYQSCLKSKEMLYIFGGRDSAICVSNMKGNFFYSFFSFLLTLGPPLPKALNSHSMLEINGDAFIFGGYFGSSNYNSAIYKITCSSGICSWSTLNQELKVAREYFVAIPVPDTFCVQ